MLGLSFLSCSHKIINILVTFIWLLMQLVSPFPQGQISLVLRCPRLDWKLSLLPFIYRQTFLSLDEFWKIGQIIGYWQQYHLVFYDNMWFYNLSNLFVTTLWICNLSETLICIKRCFFFHLPSISVCLDENSDKIYCNCNL